MQLIACRQSPRPRQPPLFLCALVLVCSVAFLPVSPAAARSKKAPAAAAKTPAATTPPAHAAAAKPSDKTKDMVVSERRDTEYGAAAKQALGIARFHYKKGDFVQAAAMFHQAYKLQPRVEFLFNAARCEQRAMKLDLAKKHFEECLAAPNVPKRVVRRVHVHLGEIKAVRAALAKARGEGKAAAATVAVRKTPPPPAKPQPTWKTPAGWGSVGVGAALLAAGGWLAVSYASGQAALDEKTAQKNGADEIVGIGWKAYEAEQNRLNSQATLRSGLIAGGAVVVGAGVWMLLTDGKRPARTALVPTGARGVAWVVWF